jgi:hypothetical protein
MSVADFFWDLGESIENFFSTDLAAVLGLVFVASAAVLVLLLIRHFEKK